MKNRKLTTQLFLGIALISFNCNASNIAGYNGDFSEEEALQIAISLSQSEKNIAPNHNPVASTSTSTSTSTTGAEPHSPNYNSIVFGGVRGSGTRWKSTDDKNSLVVNLIDNADVKANAFKVSDLEAIKKKLGGKKVELLHFEKMGFGFPIAWGDILTQIKAGKTKDQIDWKFIEVPGYLKDFPDTKTYLKSADYSLGNAYKNAKNIAKIYASMLKSGGKLKYKSYVLPAGTDRNVSTYGFVTHAFALVPDLDQAFTTFPFLINVFGDPFVNTNADKSYLRKNIVYNATVYFSDPGYNNGDVEELQVMDVDSGLDDYYSDQYHQPAVDKEFLKKRGGSGILSYQYHDLLKSHYYLTQIYKIVLGKAGFKNIKVFLRSVGSIGSAQLVVEATKK